MKKKSSAISYSNLKKIKIKFLFLSIKTYIYCKTDAEMKIHFFSKYLGKKIYTLSFIWLDKDKAIMKHTNLFDNFCSVIWLRNVLSKYLLWRRKKSYIVICHSRLQKVSLLKFRYHESLVKVFLRAVGCFQ